MNPARCSFPCTPNRKGIEQFSIFFVLFSFPIVLWLNRKREEVEVAGDFRRDGTLSVSELNCSRKPPCNGGTSSPSLSLRYIAL